MIALVFAACWAWSGVSVQVPFDGALPDFYRNGVEVLPDLNDNDDDGSVLS